MDPVTATAAMAAAAGVAGAWQMRRRARLAESEAEALRAELVTQRWAASHDPLTELLNRRAFYRQGSAIVADPERHPLVAVVLDLDHFKQINDSLGHAAGDEVLSTVARRLAAGVEGNLAARLGGDEFAGLVTLSADGQWLGRLVARLTELLSLPVSVGGYHVRVSASVGTAVVRGLDITHFTEALRAADHDMYRVKAARRERLYARHDESTPYWARPTPQILGLPTHQVSRSIAWTGRHAEAAIGHSFQALSDTET